MNTTDFLLISNSIVPDRAAIIFEKHTFTFGQLNDRVNRLTHALLQLGIRKGDMVAVLQVNCNQYIEIYYATAKLGAIFVPLNFRSRADELEFMLTNCEAKFLFAGGRYLPMIETFRGRLPHMAHVINLDSDSQAGGAQPYENLLASAPPDDYFQDIADDDITVMMYTAGTTGRPKGVPLTHNSFASYMLENVSPCDPEISETNLLTVPLYHVAGIQALMAATYGGRTLAIMKQFEVREWMSLVQTYKADRAMLVPTMLKRVVDDPDLPNYDLSSLKVITYGAAPMPFEVIKKAIHVFPDAMFINAFGQTETASTITSLGPEDHKITGTEEEKAKKLKRLQYSIGKPMSDVQIRIVDPLGNDLPAGEIGELLAKGPRVMSGYWKEPEKTKTALTEDGWLHTNDRGYADEDGYIYLAGRGDDMIIRGGENISPGEIENALGEHPAVDECAVIGIDDPEWGQEVMAVVVIRQGYACTAEELIDFCKPRLAGFKRPRFISFADELPRTSTGKLLKRVLRDQFKKRGRP
jgi:acyl-CoA synthetase (AMP-forming)/AMP-acid ligase II